MWSDGDNWQTGHWINGRVGGAMLQNVISEICADVDLIEVDSSSVKGLVTGFVIDRPMRARDALSPLMDSYDLVMSEHGGQVRFTHPNSKAAQPISSSQLIAQERGPVQFSVQDNMASPLDVRLTFIDAGRDYQTATISARNDLAETVRIADIQAPIAMDVGQARRIVEQHLNGSESTRRRAHFSIPPKAAEDLHPGSVVTLPNSDENWQVDRLRHGLQTDVDVVGLPDGNKPTIVTGIDPMVMSDPAWVSEPVALAFDIPGTMGLQVGALLNPFRPVEISMDVEAVSTESTVKLGALLSPLPRGSVNVWDKTSVFEVLMPNGVFFSALQDDVMRGHNHFAVETETGWEVLGAADITLIAPETYRFQTLLRGLQNSDDNMMDLVMMDLVASGARIVALDGGLADLQISSDFVGERVELAVTSMGRSGVKAYIDYRAGHLRPLSVVHLKATPFEGETRLDWIPRRLDGETEIDPSAKFEITWPSGAIIASGTSAIIPVTHGSNTRISIVPLHPLTSPGDSSEITV